MTTLERLLTQIEAQCRAAREALADEHEGNVKRSVFYIELDALEAVREVASW